MLSDNLLTRIESGDSFGVADLETTNIREGEQKFLLAGLFRDGTYRECDSIVELIEYFIVYGGVFFFHNLSYDIRFIFQELNDNFLLKFVFARSKLINVKVYDKRKQSFLFEIRDSYALLPFSLKRLSRTFDVRYKKMNVINFDKEEFDINNKEHREYLKHDCLSLYEVLTVFFEKFNIDKRKLTISSIAYNKWKDSYDLNKHIFTKKKDYDFLRDSYYGGRVEVFKGFLEDGFYYDVNSMYPFVMKHYKYPVNYYVEVEDMSSSNKVLGVYDCEVEVKDIDIPLLPYRHEEKLVFPVGKFRGWYTSPEIRKAMKLGYEIDVKWGFEWDYTDGVFNSYVDDFYRQKCKAEINKDKILYSITKLFLNSLSGKFGQRQYKEYIEYMSNEEKAEFFIQNPEGELKTFGDNYVIKKGKHFISNYAVQISAFITSYARLNLYSIFEDLGFENVYYCDTDSVFTTELIETNKKLGGLSLVDEIKEAVFLAPKMYAYKTHDNKLGLACKGFNVNRLSYNDFYDALFNHIPLTEKIIIPTSLRMAFHRGYNPLRCYSISKEYDRRKNNTKRKNEKDSFATKPIRIG